MVERITVPTPAARQVGRNLYWLGGCFVARSKGREVHSHLSTYFLDGDSQTALVDTGHPKDWRQIERDLDFLLDGRELTYIFPTHEEYPHAGNLGKLMRKFPETLAVGEVRNWELYLPEFVDRIRYVGPYSSVKVGGETLTLLPGVIHDLPATAWAYAHSVRAMFVSDGFAYSHEHEAEQCRLLGSELPAIPDREAAAYVNETALYWTSFVDPGQLQRAVHDLLSDFVPDLICPAHGNVIDECEAFIPSLLSALGH